MKKIKIFFVILISFLILWIDLPENLKIRFSLPKLKEVKFAINPLSINTNIFGMKIKKDFKTRLGLDLKGGSHLVFEADVSKVDSADLVEALNSVRDVMEKRVNYFGVSEPVVKTLKSGDSYRVSVDLPGIKNLKQAVNLVGETAQLSFREEMDGGEKIASNTPLFLRFSKQTGLTGKDTQKATVTFNSQTGKPQVALSFTDKGKRLFAKITRRNVNKRLAIFLDNSMISAPVVQQEITDGNAVISGSFNLKEAKNLALSINSGALALPVKLIEQKTIGASLGDREIKKSVYAGGVGLLMVLFFMIAYYGRLGIIASIALIIYGLISLAVFRLIPVVLTLPGIAGFILSIGMAVDSNILIFERIKEELNRGLDFKIAANVGFGRALDAIKDANFTTLTVAFILFNPLNWEFLPQFGMVRGFAMTLGVGVATSLFTGVVITKKIIDFFHRNKLIN